jgi:hypothetical protein
MIAVGCLSLIIALLLLGDRMPAWLGLTILIGLPYGLIFWT